MAKLGTIVSIHIASTATAPMAALASVRVVMGRGLEGDRYFNKLGQARRNIVTENVALNHLVDREFKIGDVVLRGSRLCDPCAHLEKLTCKGVMRGLVHRGGLRAEIISGGTIRAGDPLVSDL